MSEHLIDRMEKIKVNNLVFHEAHWVRNMNKEYIFVTVRDLGNDGVEKNPPWLKHYWGEGSSDSDDSTYNSVVNVIERGGKWETLEDAERGFVVK